MNTRVMSFITALTGGGALYTANEYKNYIVLEKKKENQIDVIVQTYFQLIAVNSEWESLQTRKKNSQMVASSNIAFHFPEEVEEMFGRSYWSMVGDLDKVKKKIPLATQECINTLKILFEKKEELSSINSKLTRNLFSRVYFDHSFNREKMELEKKIAELPCNSADKEGLTLDLAHWNTRFELCWLDRTAEEELPSIKPFAQSCELLQEIKFISEKYLITKINNDKEKLTVDFNFFKANSFAHLEMEWKNLEQPIKHINNLSDLLQKNGDKETFDKEFEKACKSFQALNLTTAQKSEEVITASQEGLQKTNALEEWERRGVEISKERWNEKRKETLLLGGKIFALQSIEKSEMALFNVLSTFHEVGKRKMGNSSQD